MSLACTSFAENVYFPSGSFVARPCSFGTSGNPSSNSSPPYSGRLMKTAMLVSFKGFISSSFVSTTVHSWSLRNVNPISSQVCCISSSFRKSYTTLSKCNGAVGSSEGAEVAESTTTTNMQHRTTTTNIIPRKNKPPPITTTTLTTRSAQNSVLCKICAKISIGH